MSKKMKLWVLEPRIKADSPWDNPYDKVHGFVVRAPSSHAARMIAHTRGGDEVSHPTDPAARNVWLDPKTSTCRQLFSEGDVGIVMKNQMGA